MSEEQQRRERGQAGETSDTTPNGATVRPIEVQDGPKRAKTYNRSIAVPDSHPYPLTKDEVARLYYEELLSLNGVAKIAGTSRQRLARWMEYWGLPRRTSAEGWVNYCGQTRTSRSPNWRGGSYKARSSNTWYTYAPQHPKANDSGSVPTHILAAEERIARYLGDREVVHHLDKDRDNNHPDNLCVMLRGEHLVLHRVLGEVGIALLKDGALEQVLSSIADARKRRFVGAVYGTGLPCATGLLAKDS